MHINSKDKIANISILKVRDFLKAYSNEEGWSKAVASYRLGISEQKAAELIDELLKLEYIEFDRTYKRKKFWRKTLKGSTFGLASAAKPILRTTAEKKLSEFMDRVKTVNSSDKYLLKITEVLVFGSYIRDTPKLNDVDVAVKAEWKENHIEVKGKDKAKISINHAKKAEEKGRCFGSYMDALMWPYHQVMLFLKSKSRVISLHETDDEILKTAEYKTLFIEK